MSTFAVVNGRKSSVKENSLTATDIFAQADTEASRQLNHLTLGLSHLFIPV